jgi:hypothetical protein
VGSESNIKISVFICVHLWQNFLSFAEPELILTQLATTTATTSTIDAMNDARCPGNAMRGSSAPGCMAQVRMAPRRQNSEGQPAVGERGNRHPPVATDASRC